MCFTSMSTTPTELSYSRAKRSTYKKKPEEVNKQISSPQQNIYIDVFIYTLS